MNTKSEVINVLPYQVDHYHRLCHILQNEYGYLDTSETGTGKTILTLSMCATYGLSLLVVCNLSAVGMWKREAQSYGIHLILVISYSSLRGTRSCPPKHGLLERHSDDYIVTQHFIQLVKQGILMVFDEIDNLKNSETDQLKAAHCLVRAIVQLNCGSRIALLSATPTCENYHTESILKILGIISYDKLYRYDHSLHEYELLGIQEVINKCRILDPVKTNALVQHMVIDKRTANPLCYDLYTQILKHHVSSSMPNRIIMGIMKDAKNGYYDMEAEDLELLSQGIKELIHKTQYRQDTDTIRIGQGGWNMLRTSLIMCERAKLSMMIRLARTTFQIYPQSKVILYLNYIDHLKYVTSALSEFNPLLMYGQTSLKERDFMIEKFQQPNSEYRLLISTVRVGGISINLDDRDGHWPRFMFIIPSYYANHLHQATGRIFRSATTKSSATIRIVYSKQFKHESKILNALAQSRVRESLTRKAKITKGMLYDETNIVFPGEYQSYVEGAE